MALGYLIAFSAAGVQTSGGRTSSVKQQIAGRIDLLDLIIRHP